MKIYLVDYFKHDDMEPEIERETFLFLKKEDAIRKSKELVDNAVKEIVNDDLWEDCNENDYSEKEIREEFVGKDGTSICYCEGCGYNELEIGYEEREVL